jgi:hypothetical protein
MDIRKISLVMLGHGARESQGSDEFVIKSVNLLRQNLFLVEFMKHL